MKIIIAFLVAVLFFLAFKVISVGLKSLLNRYSRFYWLGNLILASELIVWIVYIFWVTDFLFHGKFYYTYLIYTIILIVCGFIAWFLLRDIFAGMIFRIKHDLKTGSYIRTGDFSGQIKTQQLTYIKIMVGDGQLLRIPYSRIINDVITEMPYPGSLEQHIVQIQVDSTSGKTNIAELLIRSAILNTPWSNLKEEPSIRFLGENDQGYIFEITFLSANTKQIRYIEMALEENPSIHVISK